MEVQGHSEPPLDAKTIDATSGGPRDADLQDGRFLSPDRDEQIALVMTTEFLNGGTKT
jgi:hypothetical protein